MTAPNRRKRAAPATGCCFSFWEVLGEGGAQPRPPQAGDTSFARVFRRSRNGLRPNPAVFAGLRRGNAALRGCTGRGVGLMGRAPASPPRRALRLRRSRRLRRRPRLRRGPGGEAAVCSIPCRLPMRPAASADPAAPLDGVGHRSYNGSMHETGGAEGEKNRNDRTKNLPGAGC